MAFAGVPNRANQFCKCLFYKGFFNFNVLAFRQSTPIDANR